MNDNGLSNVMSLIKKQKWENLFKRRELMHTAACKEFYANLTVFIYKKKEIPKSNEYIKDVWEESKYIKPLEIIRKFANNSLINVARRVQLTEMKPFQRFVHFVVMKNMVPRLGKRDTTSFMDLTYMDHLVSGRKINLPRVMMRHMAYVISVKDLELPYGDWMSMIFDAFGVPLVDKKGEEPKMYDYFEETFLTMCMLRREDGIWWIGTGENRRRDDAPEEEAPTENVHEEEEEGQTDFDWEAVVDEAALEGESGSSEKFYDAEDEVQESPEENEEVPAVVAPDSTQQKVTETAGVDPSGPSGHLPEFEMLKLQDEFERTRANRFQADL
ncbi:hypothetical protein Dimus_029391 [Dionaea muscipula]